MRWNSRIVRILLEKRTGSYDVRFWFAQQVADSARLFTKFLAALSGDAAFRQRPTTVCGLV